MSRVRKQSAFLSLPHAGANKEAAVAKTAKTGFEVTCVFGHLVNAVGEVQWYGKSSYKIKSNRNRNRMKIHLQKNGR
jgi:hypothetical protein